MFTFNHFQQVRLNQLNIKVLTRKRLLKLHRQVRHKNARLDVFASFLTKVLQKCCKRLFEYQYRLLVIIILSFFVLHAASKSRTTNLASNKTSHKRPISTTTTLPYAPRGSENKATAIGATGSLLYNTCSSMTHTSKRGSFQRLTRVGCKALENILKTKLAHGDVTSGSALKTIPYYAIQS